MISRSTDNGLTWTTVDSGLSSLAVYSLAVRSDGDILAGAADGIYRSTDNGEYWSKLDTMSDVRSIVINSKGNIFAGTDGGGAYRSTDGGGTWIAVNSGLVNANVYSLAFDSIGIIYAGTYGGGVFRSVQTTVGVRVTAVEQPGSFSLNQNYPNPFNPTTTISYQLPIDSFVSLKIYDVLGREVETLVDERQTAGSHLVTFKANNFASGVYFCRLQVENPGQGTMAYTATRKLLLLK